MRATTLTSMAVLALVWQSQICAAGSTAPATPAQVTNKSTEAGASKKSVSRLGSLSPDEARRAARAHARAVAALKKKEPVQTAAAPAKVSDPGQAAHAKAAELVKSLHAPKAVEAAQPSDAAKATGETDTAKATEPAKVITPDAVASKPAAPPEHVASQPNPADTTTTGRSASIDTNGTAVHETKRAIRTAERDRKRKERREARRRTRDRYADDRGSETSRYYRLGRDDQPIAAGGGYGERVVVAPQAQYGYAPGPSYGTSYPPYPQPYYGGPGY